MSGLLDNLLPGASQSSEVPLLGPILGGGDEPTSTEERTQPTASPVQVSPTPEPTLDDTRDDEEDGDDDDDRAGREDDANRPGREGDDNNNNTASESLPTLPSLETPTPTPVRTRPTFIITDVPSSAIAIETSASLPPPLTPSALPTLPSIPGPDDELIQAPPRSTTNLPVLPLPTPSDIPTTLVMAPSLPLPSPSGTAAPGDAESALADSSTSSGGTSLMPALPISLGVGGGLLFFGVLGGMLYKKGKWPFRRDLDDDGFAELEDGAAEKRHRNKWDPRVSMWRPNGATNF